MIATPAIARDTVAEEIANSVTHGLGLLCSIAAMAVLTSRASAFGTVWHVVSFGIYGATHIFMYATSTLYHGIPLPRARAVLRFPDHSAVFLLIAGTYTPFSLVSLSGPWGWSLLAGIWVLAILGIALWARTAGRGRLGTTALYAAMGWAIVIAIGPRAVKVAPGGPGLHRRHRPLPVAAPDVPLVPASTVPPRHMAPVRAGRQPPAFLRGPVLRRTPRALARAIFTSRPLASTAPLGVIGLRHRARSTRRRRWRLLCNRLSASPALFDRCPVPPSTPKR